MARDQLRRKEILTRNEANPAKVVARRSVLSLAVLSAGGLLTYRWLQTGEGGGEEPSEQDTAPAPSTSTEQQATDAPDLREIRPLTRGSNTGGIRKEYKEAVRGTNVKNVVSLTGLKTSNIPWVAVSIVSSTRQLQIFSPFTDTPAYVIDVPGGSRGGIESLVWHEQTKRLYLSTGGSLFVWDATTPNAILAVGKVAEASTLYELQIDSHGNVWGGTYPLGAPFRYDPKSKKIQVFNRVATDTDYVRQLIIDQHDQVWLGTGSRNPRIYMHSTTTPNTRIEIPLPEPMESGFVTSLSLIGNFISVSVSDTAEQYLLDVESRKWAGKFERVWSRRLVATGEPATAPDQFFTITDQKLFATNVNTRDDMLLGQLAEGSPLNLFKAQEQIHIFSQDSQGLKVEIFDLVSRKTLSIRRIELSPGAMSIHSLLATADGNLCLGAFMGEGLGILNPTTGKSWSSPESSTLINQIEGMIQFSSNQLYVGSYGYADIICVEMNNKDSSRRFQRIARLDQQYNQSRPFAWASNSGFVFFGTVPDYGASGGVIGQIDAHSNQIAWVLDGEGAGFVEGHSIIGLAADDQFLYGTTSVRNGYGIPDTPGPAKIFKMDLKTKKKVWTVTPVLDVGDYYAPQLIRGWLICADVEGLNVLDVQTGELVARHRLTDAQNRDFRAGWARADLAVLSNGKIVYSAVGTVIVIDLDRGQYSLVPVPKGKRTFGSRLAVSSSDKAYAAVDGTSLVELDLTPRA